MYAYRWKDIRDGVKVYLFSVESIMNVYRVPTGQGKLEKVREFEWSGIGHGKILFWKNRGKVRENEILVPRVRF